MSKIHGEGGMLNNAEYRQIIEKWKTTVFHKAIKKLKITYNNVIYNADQTGLTTINYLIEHLCIMKRKKRLGGLSL